QEEQCRCRGGRDASPGKRLLEGDDSGDERGPGDAHHPEREERRHQCPAAPRAPGAAREPEPESTEGAAAPRAEQERDRRATFGEAPVLERSQLVAGRDEQRCPRGPATGPVPVEESTCAVAAD